MFKLFQIVDSSALPPIELSYSKVAAYNFCPFKYFLVYEKGFRAQPLPQMSLGQSVHRALEKFHQKKCSTFDELIECYDESWVNEGFNTPQETVQYYEKGELMLRDYFAFAQKRESEIVIVEQEFKVPIGRRVLRGIVDRIDKLPDGSYEVIDYKTHAEMWSQDRIDNDLQLTLYAIGASRGFDLPVSKFSYLFLAHQTLATSQRSPAQQQQALELLETVAQKIEQRDFTPNTSQCVKCDFKLSCKFSPLKNNEHH